MVIATYQLRVLYSGEAAPCDTLDLSRPSDVLDAIPRVLSDHTECQRVEVYAGSARLFSVDGQGGGSADAYHNAEATRAALARELQHRNNNLLAIVLGLLRRTLVSPNEVLRAGKKLEQRILALGRANHLLSETPERLVTVARLVGSAMEPHATRVDIDGDEVTLGASDVQNLSLALHELTANALEYGALSVETGRIAIRWWRETENDPPTLHVTWQERHGPPVVSPTGKGQGIPLLQSLYKDLKVIFAPTGLCCQLRLRLYP